MLYIYAIKQFYLFCEKMYCIKLYFIYFKLMCLFTIPLLDAVTFDLWCFVLKSRPKKKQMNFIICIIFKIILDNCFKIWTLGRGLVLFWPFSCYHIGLCFTWYFHQRPETIFTKSFTIVYPSMYGKILIESVSAPWRKSAFYFTPLLMMLKCIENTRWK